MLGRRFDLTHYELETPVVVWDLGHQRKITVVRTRGDRYGYERQKCVITIEGERLKKARVLSVLGFRVVKASWITEKLVFIDLDVGHVAGVQAIYDAEADKVIYCESVEYFFPIEGSAANGSQPIRSETNRTPLAPGSRR